MDKNKQLKSSRKSQREGNKSSQSVNQRGRERHGQRDKGQIQRGERESKTKQKYKRDGKTEGNRDRPGEQWEKKGAERTPKVSGKSGCAADRLDGMDRSMEGPRQYRAPRPTLAREADRQAAGPEGSSAEPAGRAGHLAAGGSSGQGRPCGAAPLSGVIFHLGRLIFVPGEDNE